MTLFICLPVFYTMLCFSIVAMNYQLRYMRASSHDHPPPPPLTPPCTHFIKWADCLMPQGQTVMGWITYIGRVAAVNPPTVSLITYYTVSGVYTNSIGRSLFVRVTTLCSERLLRRWTFHFSERQQLRRFTARLLVSVVVCWVRANFHDVTGISAVGKCSTEKICDVVC